MPTYIALLRAVNVGGTGKLPMADLEAMCIAVGFTQVRTYIASGNVIFVSDQPESLVKAALETRLFAYAGKSVGVVVRTADEMAAVLASNPFPETPANWTVPSSWMVHHPDTHSTTFVGARTRPSVWGNGKSMWPMAPAWGARS